MVDINIYIIKITVCLFPAVSLIYKIQYLTGDVVLTGIDFYLATEDPVQWNSQTIVPIGINLAGPTYYSNEWHFVDNFRESGGSLWPSTIPRDPVDGYPVEIIDGSTTASALILRDNKEYRTGIYTILSEGTGQLELHFDSGNHYFSSPANYSFSVTNPTDAGIQVVISESKKYDHVRNIRVIMPGYLNSYKSSPFHPIFLNDTKDFKALRFMDFSDTNGNNMASWNDRAKPNTARENSLSVTVFPIISIKYYPKGTLFSGKYCALLTFNESIDASAGHLATGQQVDIIGSDASVEFMSDLGVPGTQSLNLAAWQTNIEMISSNSFIVAFNQYWWNSKYNVTKFIPGSMKGYVQLTINHGCSLETIIDIANTQKAAPWINIPTLADDDFVLNYARLLYNRLSPYLSIYVEYSNEVWNFIFHANGYSSAKANSLGLSSVAEFVALRSVQIFNLFKTVFGSSFYSRIMTVIASQAAGSSLSDSLLAACHNSAINPYNISIKVLAIAPYFGIGVSS